MPIVVMFGGVSCTRCPHLKGSNDAVSDSERILLDFIELPKTCVLVCLLMFNQ